MGYPHQLPVIDTLLGFPAPAIAGPDHHAEIGYMFKDMPEVGRGASAIDDLLRQMDTYGIERALVPVLPGDELSRHALLTHPDRFLGCIDVDPNDGIETLRAMERAREELGIVAAQYMPSLLQPVVPINHARAFPVYAKCIELDIPIFVNGGVPGPRLPHAPQEPGLVDDVCLHFPDLRFVFRHCCEPWVDLTIKLLLKYENLYYSTSGFAPKYYPSEIIDFANTRGGSKVLYGGYYPYGLELSRIFAELRDLPLRDEVWPQFLRDNAARVLGLDQ